jgi:6-phosphogluconolactonase
MRKVEVYPDPPGLCEAAAYYMADIAKSAIRASGRCAIALPGGTTPAGLFKLLSEEPFRSILPWSSLHFFWGDERCVPRDHPESNFGLAFELLLEPLATVREG